MISERDMEDRLWEFMDGSSSLEEQNLVRALLDSDERWKKKYAELSRFAELLSGQELETPSLRFTKNIMEQIAMHPVSTSSREYINKYVIRGLGAFFLTLITGFLIYGLSRMNWSHASTDSLLPTLKSEASRINWSRMLSNTYVNLFLLINIVLGLLVLDRFLQYRRAEDSGRTS